MNISIILPDLRGGGVERVRLVLAEEFKRQGHSVEFVLLQARGQLLSEAEALFPIHSLDCTRMRQAPIRLARYFREHRTHAILVAMWPLNAIAGIAKQLAGNHVRLVASEHVDFRNTPSHKAIERQVLKRFGRRLYQPIDSVVAVSSGVAESLVEVVGLPNDRLAVINNPAWPMASAPMTKDDYDRLAGWREGTERLIAIGTLKRQKGFDVLLHALADLRQSRDARLLILGEGSLRGDLERLAADLGVSDYVWVPGVRKNPCEFLQYAKVFVLSSHWEGFGNVIVEALAAGVSVVSTDCPSGPAEILGNGRYGHLVPVANPKKLSSAIGCMLDAPMAKHLLFARAKDFDPVKKSIEYLQLLKGGSV